MVSTKGKTEGLRTAWLAALFAAVLSWGFAPAAYAAEETALAEGAQIAEVAGVGEEGSVFADGVSDVADVSPEDAKLQEPMTDAQVPGGGAQVADPEQPWADTGAHAGETDTAASDEGQEAAQGGIAQQADVWDDSYWNPAAWNDSVWLSGKRSFVCEDGKWIFNWRLKDDNGYVRYVSWNAVFTPACLEGELEAAKIAAAGGLLPDEGEDGGREAAADGEPAGVEAVALAAPYDADTADAGVQDKDGRKPQDVSEGQRQGKAVAIMPDKVRLPGIVETPIWQLTAEVGVASKQMAIGSQGNELDKPVPVVRDPRRTLNRTGIPGSPATPLYGAVPVQRIDYTEPTQSQAVLVEEASEQTFVSTSDVSRIAKAGHPVLIRGTLSCRAP